ncbi:bifunctional 3-(3-hydroxy-phenyl)propionate/3-hydroxycinnamic acid hydroxylase [Streptomyces mirabilis]|uniref:bifunctional 3-(3-hydroxy-phenyl)propionate/3-hydroxycinnamic acid hydroxylase MhpA n=1 Tax=Streptomyces mirabilis TaxID=68239 RepID=UPI003683506A
MLDFDVIQIGFGPVGQTNAALLGQRGHRVAVFERWPQVYPLPRAGHFDHEVLRIFQGIGVAEQIERHAIPIPDYDWVNGDGTLLLHMDWNQPTPSGWKSDYLMYQPYMEDALMRAVGVQPSVKVHLGWEATEISERADHVAVTLREGRLVDGVWTATGSTRTVTAKYLVGADGAGSLVRRATGIAMTDYGFEEDWLVLDVRPHDPDLTIDMPEAGQICDPARPVSLFRWLGREHCRWEFMLLPGESPEDMSTQDKAWELLARWGLDATNADVIRRAVYTFRSLIADDFRKGRALLIGDAAHQMPPFMGQGMCTGVRDAANLAWKLDLVLRGHSPDALLDTYTVERRPHADELIKTSIALGQVVCISDPEAAAARDTAFLTGQVPPPPPFPWITKGVLGPDGTGEAVGRLGVQGRLVHDGRTGLADDVTGTGWALLSRRSGLTEILSDEQRDFLARIGARVLHVTRADIDRPDTALDLDATYARWFDRLQADVVLVRPDYYVFGTAPDVASAPHLVDALRAAVSVKATASP